MDYQPTHKQVEIEYEGTRAEVDEGIAPLIQALWRKGYETTASCEADVFDHGGHGLAYVSFPDEPQARRFGAFLDRWMPRSFEVDGEPRSHVLMTLPQGQEYEELIKGLTDGAWTAAPGESSVAFDPKAINAIALSLLDRDARRRQRKLNRKMARVPGVAGALTS